MDPAGIDVVSKLQPGVGKLEPMVVGKLEPMVVGKLHPVVGYIELDTGIEESAGTEVVKFVVVAKFAVGKVVVVPSAT